MECIISRYPPEIFKQIALDLEDEDLGALYLTGDSKIIGLLSRSITRTKYKRDMFADFQSIETIDTVIGNGKSLPPSLKVIYNFIPMVDNCMDVIPKSVTYLGITCDDITNLDQIPNHIETLNVDSIELDDDYTFRNGPKVIVVSNLTLARPDICITFPKSAIRASAIQCSNIQILNKKDLYYVAMREYKYDKAHDNITDLCTAILQHNMKLPSTVTAMSIANYIISDPTIAAPLSELQHLTSLVISSRSPLISKYIPKSLKFLNVLVSGHVGRPIQSIRNYSIQSDDDSIMTILDQIEQLPVSDKTFNFHEGMTDLVVSMVTITALPINLPSTLTSLTALTFDANLLDNFNLPHLTYICVKDLPNRNKTVLLHDFNKHPNLRYLSVDRPIFLKNLPDTLAYLCCNSISGSKLPSRLQILEMDRATQYSIDMIKEKLEFCRIAVKNTILCAELIYRVFAKFDIDYLLCIPGVQVIIPTDEAIVDNTYILKVIVCIINGKLFENLTPPQVRKDMATILMKQKQLAESSNSLTESSHTLT